MLVYESSDTLVTTVRDGIIHAGLKEGHADINVTYTDGLGTIHQTTIGVDASVPTNLYNWKAYDWYKNRVADRLGASDIAYSSKDNTINTWSRAQNTSWQWQQTFQRTKTTRNYGTSTVTG